MAFDAYHKWLGIPAAEQPPNHYRLLAIALFEDDPDVIETATDQRTAHVRTFQTGPHSALSQQLLNELAVAKLCLLDPASRQAYDDELRRRLSPVLVSGPVAVPVVPMPVQPVIQVNAPAAQAPSFEFTVEPSSRGHRTRGHRASPAVQAWLALASVAVLAAILGGYLISTKGGHRVAGLPPKEPPPVQQDPLPAEENPSAAQQAPPKRESTPESVKEPDPPDRVEALDSNPGEVKRFAFEIPDSRRARWSLEGDELVQSSHDFNISILFGDPRWEDFDYSVEARSTEGRGGIALWFRHKTDGDAERYVAGHRTNFHTVSSANQGQLTRLASREGSLPVDTWYRLEVRVRGNAGRCFLDGIEILSFECPRGGRGRVGLGTGGTTYRFRNIVVKAPDGRVLLEGLPDLNAEPPAKIHEIDENQMLADRGGSLPTTRDGRPLNLDFEQGDLRDWSAEGDAFSEQPVKGDTLHARYKYLKSRHAGQFWVGSGETKGNAAKGTLTSAPFKVTHPYASFLIAGGGPWTGTCVELLRRDGDRSIFRAVGHCSDMLEPVVVDLTEHLGHEIVIRVADRDDGEWGRIGFDDFRFHNTRPNLLPAYARANTISSGGAVDVLKLVDIERDARGGVWQWDDRRWLAATATNARMLRLPVDVPEQYNLAVTLEGAPSVDDIYLLLPAGGQQVLVIVDGWGKSVSGVHLIDGKPANDNESTHRGAVLRDGGPNRLVCRVRRESVTLVCNGETVIDWRGDSKQLSMEFGKVAGWEGLGIGGVRAGFRVSQIELTSPDSPSGGHAAPVNSAAVPTKRGNKLHFPSEMRGGMGADWSIEGDELVRRPDLPETTILFGEPSWTDYDFSFDAKVQKGWFGRFYFRYQDEKNFHSYGIGAWDNTWELVDTMRGGAWGKRQCERHVAIPGDAWQQIHISVRGEKGRCFRNGTIVGEFSMPHLSKGRVGFVTEKKASYRFRNIVVKSPTGRILLKGLPDVGEVSTWERNLAGTDGQRTLGDLITDEKANNQKLAATEAFALKRHEGAVTRLAFHRTQPLLASAGKDGRVLLWNLQTRMPLELHKFGEEVWALKFHPGGDCLAFANRNWWGSRLFFKTLVGLKLNEIRDFKNGGGAVASIAYSHDGRLFAAGQDDGTIRLWDGAQLSEIPPVAFGGGHNIYAMALGAATFDRKSKRTEYRLAAGGQDGLVRILMSTIDDKNGGATFQPSNVQFAMGGAVLGLRFSPRGNLLGCTHSGGRVSLCDPGTGKLIRDLAQGGGSAEWIAFHPQRSWCVTAHKNGQVARIWNTETAELLCELKGHTAGVMCAEFSPDGSHVATASEDLSIKLWNLAGADVPAAPSGKKKTKPVVTLVGD